MLKIVIPVLLFASSCFALSPAEQWVMNSWLMVDGSGDLNNDGVCDTNDLALASQHDVKKFVIWGRTEGVQISALQIAIAEASYSNQTRLASTYRRQLAGIIAEGGYYSDPITGPARVPAKTKGRK